MKRILLIVEKSIDNEVWGRVCYDDNLLVDSSASIEQLQKKMKKLLHDFHGLDATSTEFDLAYDLTAVFSAKSYLNLSVVAEKAGINRSLMAQYAAGTKHPSMERAQQIEAAIHDLGRDLLSLRIAVKGRRVGKARAKKRVRQKV